MTKERWPLITSNCADCGIGTSMLGELEYMVRDEVWEQAWAGRHKPWHELPGQQILCIGCLEQRLGRTLMSCDFIGAQVNGISDRLRDRLTTEAVRRKPDRPKGSKNKHEAVLRKWGVETIH